ncbi:glutathione S-transferase N-terminal domain-containing protein [Maritimibacter sp. UBA3975]|uniref:glutathione S-transferase N-terminal domain-containing protein n=1 Tax=Maritimibacter sp. UBA3975 TaxID=1946833 RepID=UPI000C0B2C12|nr:glutathione S-transferase N-terminal domain-containing protein [Maritimibacter sp. UBA3975]MAM60907.1 glutathione S-transferase [Maritimibacter sp.]|tara:strand:- start:6025 stop:6738 length:714 start_codon:yes stop_codon:yes gene_type:complete
MKDADMLTDFPITKRWPAEDPSKIQLYSLPTPNGIKVSAMLEETGLAYEPHLVNIMEDDQFTPEFLSLNPNNKIPALIDPDGPGGQPLGLFETGAILIYLADKTGLFLSQNPAEKYETIQWLMWQMGGVGPMFGQLGFFYAFGGKDIEDPRPRERYIGESKRLLGVLDKRLDGREFLMGDDYTIADIATWPWVRGLTSAYKADDVLELATFENVLRWRAACMARPASEKAVNIPGRP